MDLLRKLIWLWVIVGMIFVGLVISLIFLLINKCISRGGKHRISELHKRSDFNITSNKYQERNLKANNPPLPPRTQFLTAETQSYENLAEEQNYEQSVPDYEQDTADYEQSIPDYVQGLDEQPDYVKMDKDPDPAEDNTSTEDYDDIGGEGENQDEEDYDDVG